MFRYTLSSRILWDILAGYSLAVTRSGNFTLLNSLWSHLKTEYFELSSENPLSVFFFLNEVEVLYNCFKATIDICFVHSLIENQNSTWTAHEQFTLWLKMLLLLKLSKACILTYGYDTYIVQKSVASSNQLINHATNLLNDLMTDRACCNASFHLLIFVTHSLSGLVCKKVILLLWNNPEAHLWGIFNCIKDIIFMSTSHKKAWIADWVKILALALDVVKFINKLLLKTLEMNDQLLKFIQVRFWAMIQELWEGSRCLKITCFFEELPLCAVEKVVFKDSATLEGYNLISIHVNHRDMVKFGSVKDNKFKRLLKKLIR